MLLDSLNDDNSFERRNEEILKRYEEESGDNVFDELIASIRRMSEILGKSPEVIVLNYDKFGEWFKWCQENDWDFTDIGGIAVAVNKDSPASVAFIGEKNAEYLKRINK